MKAMILQKRRSEKKEAAAGLIYSDGGGSKLGGIRKSHSSFQSYSLLNCRRRLEGPTCTESGGGTRKKETR